MKVIEAIAAISLVIVVEIGLHHFGIPAWSVFLALILFLLAHKQTKEIPRIFAGGIVGIMVSLLTTLLIQFANPLIGSFAPKLIVLSLFLFSLIVFGHRMSYFLNDYAFAYFLVCSATKGFETPVRVILGLLVGGGIMMLGILLIDSAIKNQLPSWIKTWWN
jgi:hypothetical protein